MKLRSADPFAAMVDFMAFMVLISIFLFIVSESNIPIEEGSKANVFSYRITTKSAQGFSHELLTSRKRGEPQGEIEMTLWFVDNAGKVRVTDAVLNKSLVTSNGNQSEVFGIAPEDAPQALILSFSHLENLDLIGTYVEMAIDVQFGKSSCSVDWAGKIGVDPGVNLDFGRCSAS